MIHPERINILNEMSVRDGRYVLYWMQGAQRAHYNHALEYAIREGNKRNKPIVAAFGLTDDYPEANLRHYKFMLEGLKNTQQELFKRGIKLVIIKDRPERCAIELASDADLLITDDGYLKVQKKWRQNVAGKVKCAMFEVATNVIVPVQTASDKENYSAATLRPRIKKQLKNFIVKLKHTKPKKDSLGISLKSFDITDTNKALEGMNIDKKVLPVKKFKGGTNCAKSLLREFIKTKLGKYDTLRNDPTVDYQSNLSPYLHFGQISPLYIAIEVMKSRGKGREAFLEELIVRRELSHNFVYYNNNYDNFNCLPMWAQRTLNFHARDKREYVYSLEEFEKAQTHDAYWNAAQKQMLITGKMHGYMRMYWGKKILEWSKTAKQAFKSAIYLNNKYELDGRDPNGFAGVAWCFGKHDRPWGRRKVCGQVRYMNAAGLKRKFDADEYVEKIKQMENKRSKK